MTELGFSSGGCESHVLPGTAALLGAVRQPLGKDLQAFHSRQSKNLFKLWLKLTDLAGGKSQGPEAKGNPEGNWTLVGVEENQRQGQGDMREKPTSSSLTGQVQVWFLSVEHGKPIKHFAN